MTILQETFLLRMVYHNKWPTYPVWSSALMSQSFKNSPKQSCQWQAKFTNYTSFYD